MKKFGFGLAVVLLTLAIAAGSVFASDDITVISREEGSGTRGAFIELFGVQQKDAKGNKVDMTVDSAQISNSTGVVLTSVAQDETSIGYISLGSLNDTVKALKIDGAEAKVENIVDGSYKISRPFNIAVKKDVSDVAKDFISFILSSDGQKIVEDNGYIKVSDAAAYAAAVKTGRVVVAGSSSVSPLMEKLIEAYKAVNPDVKVELQTSDSTTGMTSAMQGICDIGMASRELKNSEISGGLTPTVIAKDGIAVIVNKTNKLDAVTADQVRDIYTGKITKWSEIK